MDYQPEYLPEGQYIVEFTNSDNLDPENIDYSRMVMVISMEVKLARYSILVGGLKPLLEALSDFEYCCSINRTNPAYTTSGIWVVEPKDPRELEKLKDVLRKHSIMYAFNDGTSYLSLANSRMGSGVHSTVSIEI
ncbi:MAG: hypothetical protein GQ582_00985 [Methyloprofundus sp.]|nr:hypothetical protein [Methyloprofundus sp.]